MTRVGVFSIERGGLRRPRGGVAGATDKVDRTVHNSQGGTKWLLSIFFQCLLSHFLTLEQSCFSNHTQPG